MMMGEIAPLNLADIIDRLLDLHAYSPELAKRFDHEEELPEEDAALYLVRRLAECFDKAENSEEPAKAEAYEELAVLLIRSYRYYVCRLAMARGRPWVFSFPARQKDEVVH